MKDKNILKGLLINIIILIVSLNMFRWFGSTTRCIIKNFVGIPCPSCGMTRALENFIKGNYEEAFYFHPLFFIVILISILFILKNTKTINKIWISSRFWIILIIAFLVVYVIRMFIYFPDIAPMNYYKDNIILNILR